MNHSTQISTSTAVHGSTMSCFKRQYMATFFLLLICIPLMAKKMNVLFIPIDDLKPLMACYGYDQIHSPNIDRLASMGTVFMNNSCQQAICGPSRASLMTGRYPHSTKVFDLYTKMRDVNPDILSIPQYFRQNGYDTTGIGKTYDPRCVDKFLDKPSWSIRYHKSNPFPEDIGAPAGGTGGYRDPKVMAANNKAAKLIKQMRATSRDKGKAYMRKKSKEIYRSIPFSKPTVECADVPDTHYVDGNNTTKALELMQQLAKSDKPFFLSVGYSRPHLPFNAPKKYWDMYDRNKISLTDKPGMIPGLPTWVYQFGTEMRQGYTEVPARRNLPEDMKRELIHGYYACVSYIDAQVGLLLDGLKENGVKDNTIVCLWGDHGFHLGDHENWCKHSNFEEAVRSPLIIAAPQQLQKGAKSESPVEFVDIFPTLCELADLEIPSVLEGKSLVPQLNNAEAEVRKAAFHAYPRNGMPVDKMGYSLRSKRYRYVKWLQIDYKKNEKTGILVGTELYDYEKDPKETTNFADNSDYAKVVAMFEDEFKQRDIAQHRSVAKENFGLAAFLK
ncbi:MAG: sulfatase [Planctomycetes bacterium]|nr:sulfatase [Planctomycetota bacterium]